MITNLFKGVTMWGIKQIIIGIRFAFPWAVGLLLTTSGISIRLSILAIIAMYKGIHPVAAMIAEEWKDRAINGGFPTPWAPRLFNIFYGLAVCTILAGWMILFFIAVFTLNLSFNLMF